MTFHRSLFSRADLLAAQLLVVVLILASCDLPVSFQEGTRLVYQLDLSGVPPSGKPGAEAEQARRVVLNRLRYGRSQGYRVHVEGDDRLVIELPAGSPLLEIKKLMARSGKVAFHLVAEEVTAGGDRVRYAEEERKYREALGKWVRELRQEPKNESAGLAGEPAPSRPSPPEFIVRDFPQAGGKVEPVVLWNAEESRIDGKHVVTATPAHDDGLKPAVSLTLGKEGAARMRKLSTANLGRKIAIVVEDQVAMVATIKSPLSDESMLSGDFTNEEILRIIAGLRSGSLPAPLKLIEEAPLGEGRVGR